jgi:hypothetical protein
MADTFFVTDRNSCSRISLHDEMAVIFSLPEGEMVLQGVTGLLCLCHSLKSVVSFLQYNVLVVKFIAYNSDGHLICHRCTEV